uniref:hypothetical protein n=1 Tax=Nocardia jejuensis TaxID=328049 RepID=UPI000A77FBCB
MSDDLFPSRHGARHGHRYREESENLGGATNFDTPHGTRSNVEHGEWGARQSWDPNAHGAASQPESGWGSAAPEWNAQPQWDANGDWNNQTAWDAPESGQCAPEAWNATPASDGWAAPNPDLWAGQSRSNWDPSADPSPSGDYRPVYSFRSASGEKLEFSGDGARVDRHGRDRDSDTADSYSTRSGGRRRAGGAHRLPA